MLGVQEERCHMSLRRERHVCLLALAQALLFIFYCSDFLFPIFSQYPMQIQGSKTSKGRKSMILLHIFNFGDMSISNVELSTHSTCHPSLGSLVVSLVCSGQ